MKSGWPEVKLGHFGIRDLDSFGITLARHLGFDCETRLGGGIADKAGNGFKADRGPSPPVLSDK